MGVHRIIQQMVLYPYSKQFGVRTEILSLFGNAQSANYLIRTANFFLKNSFAESA